MAEGIQAGLVIPHGNAGRRSYCKLDGLTSIQQTICIYNKTIIHFL